MPGARSRVSGDCPRHLGDDLKCCVAATHRRAAAASSASKHERTGACRPAARTAAAAMPCIGRSARCERAPAPAQPAGFAATRRRLSLACTPRQTSAMSSIRCVSGGAAASGSGCRRARPGNRARRDMGQGPPVVTRSAPVLEPQHHRACGESAGPEADPVERDAAAVRGNRQYRGLGGRGSRPGGGRGAEQGEQRRSQSTLAPDRHTITAGGARIEQ